MVVDVGGTANTSTTSMEHQDNGPLFTELKFYQRVAKSEHIKKWMKDHQLSFLGIPAYWGSGLVEHNGKSYRFMVLDRLGIDLQKVLEASGNQLSKTTALQIGSGLLDILEFIHEHEYIHGDIKSANLLLGFTNHKEVIEGHEILYSQPLKFETAPSRRGDLEILGYCMLQWLCGKLPWEQKVKDPVAVQEAKIKFMENLPTSVRQCFPSGSESSEIINYFSYVSTLKYEEKPQYQKLRNILLNSRYKCVDSQFLLDIENFKNTPSNHKIQNAAVTRQTPPEPKSTKEKSSILQNVEHPAPLRLRDRKAEVTMIGQNKSIMTGSFESSIAPQVKVRKPEVTMTVQNKARIIGPTELPIGPQLTYSKPVVMMSVQKESRMIGPTVPSIKFQNQIQVKFDILQYGSAVLVLVVSIILVIMFF
ncbi:serine/threonine-protein kinase VRK1-like [Rhincodon typus]|uniref:serine/threonine-protein kinase VRK1-like n=1 Tax=Rhincodon typus TaxID=259920 RepID=UPI00202E9163|nr:serine/threonine-protein kinase VRK1-like [Rhincodon typus]